MPSQRRPMTDRPAGPLGSSALLWLRMLETAERLDARDPQGSRVAEELATLEEAFGTCFDPADEFPEFVAMQFCRALRRRLE